MSVPDPSAVLAALTDLDVEETPHVELFAKVQDWQEPIDNGWA